MTTTRASAALLVAAVMAAAAVMPGAHAVEVDEEAVLEKLQVGVGDYNLNWQSTKYAPVSTPAAVPDAGLVRQVEDAARLNAGANANGQEIREAKRNAKKQLLETTRKEDCTALYRTRKELHNPTHIKFTLDNTKEYDSLASLAAAIHATTDADVLRAPMFTMAWGGTHHLIKPLAHDFGDAENAPFASDNADSEMPRTYDPRFTGRHLVAVVPHGDFAAFKAALHKQDGDAGENGPADTSKIHLVGARPLEDNGDAMDAAKEAVFWSFGWMRHATLSLMKALHAERAGVNRAWFIDSNVIALVTKDGILGTPAHFDTIESDAPWDAAAWAHGALSDYDRVKQSPATIWARTRPGVDSMVHAEANLNAAQDVIRVHDHGADNQVRARKDSKDGGVGLMEQALYVNLDNLGPFSFPSAFVRSKEDLSLYVYLTQRNFVKHAAGRHAEKVHWAKMHGLKVIKTAAPAPLAIPEARGGVDAVVDGVTRAENHFYSDARLDLDNNYHDCSMAEFVRDRVRGACVGEDPLDTASKVVEIVMNWCVEHAYSDLLTVDIGVENPDDHLSIDHFFRAATDFAVARA